MKEIILSLFVLFALGLNAQQQTDIVEELNELLINEPGKIFVFCKVQDTVNHHADTAYIAIIDDEWETYSFKVGVGFSSDGQTEFEISPAKIQPVKQRKISSNTHLSYVSNDAILFEEVPAKYLIAQPIIVIENGDTIITVPTQKVIAKRLVEKGGFKYITKEEAMKMDKSKVLTVLDNVVIKEYLSSGNCRPQMTIQSIQEALNERGYRCVIDNILGKETKNALIQFQKDNNLPQGRLDIESLKKLNVYPKGEFIDY